MTIQKSKKSKIDKTAPKFSPNQLMSFLFELVDEMASFLIKIGETEKKYGVSLESFGEIFQGEPFRLIVKEMDPKNLGLFMQFIMELSANDSLGLSNIDKLTPEEKISKGKKLQSALSRYSSLRIQLDEKVN
ncbi:MAG: hypothetical protein ACP5NK_00900 [Thermoplasmata archaeon]